MSATDRATSSTGSSAARTHHRDGEASTAGPRRDVAVSAHFQLLELMHVLRDPIARVFFLEEAIEKGASGIAWSVARDLKIDLRAAVAEWEGKR